MSKHRIGSAGSAYWSVLEEGGGVTASIVTGNAGRHRLGSVNDFSDEDPIPELVLSKANVNKRQEVELTPETLEGIARQDTISDVIERICSYICISSKASPHFGYATLADDFHANDAFLRSRIKESAVYHWQIVERLMFNDSPSLSLGIQNFLQSWLTVGKIYCFILRDKEHGLVQKIRCTNYPAKEVQYGKRTYWTITIGDKEYTIWEQEDMFILDYSAISKYYPSFVAAIRRSYNIYHSIERTRIANAIMTAQFRSIYTVPTKGLGKKVAQQRLSKIMATYKRDIRIDDANGEVTLNGENNWPVNTDIWVAETGAGSVKIENPGDGNVNLNNTDLVELFMRRFYKRAKLPLSKYEAVDTGYLNGLGELDEDERQFKIFIQNHRDVLSKFFAKLIYRLMSALKEYAGDKELEQAIYISFYDEPKHETPTEELDGVNEKMDKINDTIDKYIEALTKCGFGQAQAKARANVLRLQLMEKFCPEFLQRRAEDYRNVPKSEVAKDDETWSDASTDDNWTDGTSDSWGTSGTDDYNDFTDDDWESAFEDDDNNGDDWSMPETEDFTW